MAVVWPWIAAAAACARPGVPAGSSELARLEAAHRCWIIPPPAPPAPLLTVVIDERTAAGREAAHAILAPPAGDDATSECARAVAPPRQADSLPAARTERLAGDPRDAIDGGAAVLITADGDAVRYARSRGYRIVPTGSRVVYGIVPVQGAGVAVEPLGRRLAGDLWPRIGGSPPGPGPAENARCDAPARGATDRPGPPVIWYDAGDHIEGSLAARLVSLAVAGDTTLAAVLGSAAPRAVARPLVADRRESGPTGGSAHPIVRWRSSEAPPCVAGVRAVALLDVGGWIVVRQGTVGVWRDASGAPRLSVAPAEGAP